MGKTILLALAGFLVLGFLQTLIRRKRNPFAEIELSALPEELRSELARVFPDFRPTRIRLTQQGDEARVEGELRGETLTLEAEFDPSGAMIEFELERHASKRTQGNIEPGSLPEAVKREFDRVLGDALPDFAPRRLTTGTLGGEKHFEMKGSAGDWRWEIAVDAAGRLLEVEKERVPSAR